MKTNISLWYLAHFFLELEMFQTKVVQKIKTQIFVQELLFSFNRAVYEIKWKKTVERGRPQMTIWCMRTACWIPKAINTLRFCNTRCFSTATVVARTRLNLTLYVHCLSCLNTTIQLNFTYSARNAQ